MPLSEPEFKQISAALRAIASVRTDRYIFANPEVIIDILKEYVVKINVKRDEAKLL